ncbi:DUF1894 domain-containing protein [Methanofollis formosanus]|uniref:DUF1894 domain-containing protein n=1 Tax=Methanofollis formosanus TaxID=299308 RepID=A0A8G1A3S6_9EURY|nr:DUF1894 domain-containing protein [Methanofollis formosanus]QYZ80228.1 DUF1894 domain-containing protein [Methanofollis formosanus]
MPDMGKPHCIKRLPTKVLVRDMSEEEANEYVRKHAREHYEIPGDYEIRNICILGKGPMLVGIKERKRKLIFTFTRPCFGTDVLEMDTTPDEIERIRADLKKD